MTKRYAISDIDIEEGSLVDDGDNPEAKITMFKLRRAGDDDDRSPRDAEAKALWSTKEQNALPDSSFLHVEDGGKKDDEGKTTPRSLRHFPVKDASGKIDMPHVRNALARIPQSDLPKPVKAAATSKAQALLKKGGGGAKGMLERVKRALGYGPGAYDADDDDDDLDDVEFEQPRTVGQIMAAQEMSEKMDDLREAFCASVRSIFAAAPPDTMASMLAQSAKEFGDAISAVAPDESGAKVKSAVARLVDAAQRRDRAALAQAIADIENVGHEPFAARQEKNVTTETNAKERSLEDIIAGLPELDRKVIMMRLGALSGGVQPKPGVTSQQTTGVENVSTAGKANETADMKQRLDDFEKRTIAAESELTKMRDERESAKHLERAKALGVGEFAKVADALKAAHARSEAEGKALDALFAAQSAQLKSSKLFASLGSSQSESASPEGAIDAEAKRILGASKPEEKMTYAKAYAHVIKTRPDLQRDLVSAE